MNIRIGFSTSKTWYARVIRWFTKSKVSHTFFVVPALGHELVFEEGTFGWTVRTLEDLAKQDTIVALVTPKYPILVGFEKSLKDLGQPYGYGVLLGMFFVMIARSMGRRIRNPFRSAHSMICSERGISVLQDSGYPGSEHFDPATTTPEDLLEFVLGR